MEVEEEAGPLHRVLPAVVEVVGEVGVGPLHRVLLAVEVVGEGEVALGQLHLVLLVLLAEEVGQGWKTSHTLPFSFCFVLLVELS